MSKVKLFLAFLLLFYCLSSVDAWRRRRRRRRSCVVNCRWGPWGGYGSCSVACGGGTQTRSRGIAAHAQCGGAGCSGPSTQSRACNQQCCRVNCQWGRWTAFTRCPATCGGGTQTRTRSIATKESCGGTPCSGETEDFNICNTQCCPVDCRWNEWSEFNACSATCGGGTQTRKRSIAQEESCGGSRCLGSTSETRACNEQCCPVNCVWDMWGPFGSCSATCGGGTQTRNRQMAVLQSCGGRECEGESSETQSCNEQCCVVDCQWGRWTAFTPCPATCGGGTQTRTRSIATKESCGGTPCSGGTTDFNICNNQCCPVDCRWNEWSEFNACSATCGGGTQTRRRSIAQEESCGGSGCFGSTSETRACNEQCCPVNCVWDMWGSFGSCSATCGGGTQTRNRQMAVLQSCGGRECEGESSETQSCNEQCCVVDCQWSEWGEFDACTASCGGGYEDRSRSILVEESCGGAPCQGFKFDSRECNTQCCVKNCRWGLWGEFTPCSASCSGGEKERSRVEEVSASCGGTECVGDAIETDVCNTHNCPIDCAWSEWMEWGECSVTCGGGSQSRERTIDVIEQYGGQACEGERMESRDCNIDCCPVNCVWENWEEWGQCSETCGEGIQLRRRRVSILSSCGGLDCPGLDTEERVCNDICCPVDCEYSDWTEFGRCSKSCGTGSQSRSRVIITEESCSGAACSGTTIETQNCNFHCCPIDCVVTDWASWTECSASCGPNGVRTKTRSVAISSQCDGAPCPDLLETEPCNRVCANHGVFNGSHCVCSNSYEGLCCEEEQSVCKSGKHDCHERALCLPEDGSYRCECEDGFIGDGFFCEEQNACNTNEHDCHERALCLPQDGSYRCECDVGFAGDGFFCEEANSCTTEKHDCHEMAQCIPEGVDYRCECQDGFTGDGFFCEEGTPCGVDKHDCHDRARCIPEGSSYRCECEDGFAGDGFYCEEENACETGQHDCDKFARCVPNGKAYTCKCKDGYSGNGFVCDDVDECEDGRHDCNGLFMTCENTPGSFNCGCVHGLELIDGECIELG